MDNSPISRARNSNSFCLLPFTHMATKTHGDVKLCCRSRPVSNIKQQSLREIWNSDRYRQIRADLLSGQRPSECAICWDQEDVGVISMRQRFNVARQDQWHHVEKCSNDYSMPFEVPVLELKLSNLCNLKCRMCHPLDSSSWWPDWQSIEHLMEFNNRGTKEKVSAMDGPHLGAWDDPRFWDELAELIPHFEIVEFAGGEPLIDPIHNRIISMLAPHGDKIRLKYATNLTNLRFGETKFFDIWKKFHSIQLNVSVDGLGDVYEYVRQGADWQQLIHNIETVKQLPNVILIIQKTVQIYNVHQLPDFIEFFVNKMGCAVITHRVDFPRCLSIKCLPPIYKRKMLDSLQSYADQILAGMHDWWSPERRKEIHDMLLDEIKILMNHDNSKLLKDFIEFSDILDKRQAVAKTWRDLLPDLAAEIG